MLLKIIASFVQLSLRWSTIHLRACVSEIHLLRRDYGGGGEQLRQPITPYCPDGHVRDFSLWWKWNEPNYMAQSSMNVLITVHQIGDVRGRRSNKMNKKHQSYCVCLYIPEGRRMKKHFLWTRSCDMLMGHMAVQRFCSSLFTPCGKKTTKAVVFILVIS